jgi:hypothetical protein
MNDDSMIDDIINKLLAVKGYSLLINLILRKKPGTMVNLTESDIKLLISKCKEIFSKQPIYLELEAPITILGKLQNRNIL